VKPPINRDPQALLEEFRKLRPASRTKAQIQKDIDSYYSERTTFIDDYADVQKKGDRFEGFAEWNKNNKQRLIDLENEESSSTLNKDTLKKMHELLFSSDAITVSKVPFSDVVLMTQKQKSVPAKYHKSVNDCIDYVARFIDTRPLSLSQNSLLSANLDLNQIQIFIESGKFGGYNEWTRKGRIAINTYACKLQESLDITFTEASGFRTLAHEMMHWLDARDPSMRQRVTTFYQKRTSGEPWLKSPYGGQYKKDKWPDAYSGQRYQPLENQGFGLEVPTRGIEMLLSNPLEFAENDFEYFSFMVTEVLGTGK
jgi:hypothetical protein